MLTSIVIALAATISPSLIEHGSLDAAIAGFTGRPIGTSGGAASAVDRRLRLSACPNVRISWRTAQHDTLLVECATAPGWRLFVPVIPSVAPAMPHAAAMAGGASAGEVTAPLAIAKGDQITVAIKGHGFTISQTGQAIEGGPIGGWIKVKTVGKGEILTAQIVRAGLAIVPLT